MSASVSDSTLSFIEDPSTSSTSRADIDSLPESLDSDSDSDSDEGSSDYSDAEREWRESLQQLELLLSMVVVPYLGKYVGRKCAYWGWAKFMRWKYPVEIVVTSKAATIGAGAVAALSPL
ncbi:hypothetical protein FGG08_004463 [Glutinoglossum americanum]|uniref:Uncharacterized protein n=1 Tax=Glutinoglossum americanum TaxID=1670608 RepID=A0A9P8KZH7_9PEZI|nr:hypothetical protein FGG08_004463 [Glutinoglossum americanum]